MNSILANQTVGVMGSGTDEHDALGREIGKLLAGLGVNLLTRGGRGLITSVSRAFARAPRNRGICIGIIPCFSESERSRPRDGYPNDVRDLTSSWSPDGKKIVFHRRVGVRVNFSFFW
jgi:predicted Rossmann-fold nucleotide-binding protein